MNKNNLIEIKDLNLIKRGDFFFDKQQERNNRFFKILETKNKSIIKYIYYDGFKNKEETSTHTFKELLGMDYKFYRKEITNWKTFMEKENV